MHRKLFMSSPILSGSPLGGSFPFLPDDPPAGGGGGGGGAAGDALQQYMTANNLTAEQAAKALAESRKWEGRARANVPHEDHDKVVKELADLKSKGQTDAEKAIEKARAEGKAAATLEAAVKYGAQVVQAQFSALLADQARGVDEDRCKALVDGLATATYLKDDGTVDLEALGKWADVIAPKPGQNGQGGQNSGGQGGQQGTGGGRWPSFGQGQGQGRTPDTASAGSAEADRRFGTQK